MKTKVLTGYDDQYELCQTFNHGSIPYFRPDLIGHRTLIVAYDDADAVVGIAALTEHTVWYPDSLGVGYISTHVDYRNQGVAKILATAVFDYALISSKNISNTPYTNDGDMFLKHVMQRTSTKYPSVTLYERQ